MAYLSLGYFKIASNSRFSFGALIRKSYLEILLNEGHQVSLMPQFPKIFSFRRPLPARRDPVLWSSSRIRAEILRLGRDRTSTGQ
jgi:hypothetical protein